MAAEPAPKRPKTLKMTNYFQRVRGDPSQAQQTAPEVVELPPITAPGNDARTRLKWTQINSSLKRTMRQQRATAPRQFVRNSEVFKDASKHNTYSKDDRLRFAIMAILEERKGETQKTVLQRVHAEDPARYSSITATNLSGWKRLVEKEMRQKGFDEPGEVKQWPAANAGRPTFLSKSLEVEVEYAIEDLRAAHCDITRRIVLCVNSL